MNAGKTDRIANIFRKEIKRTSAGDAVEAWTPVEDLWVSKPQLTTGKLAEIASKSATSAMYSFESRYRVTVQPYMRAKIEGVTYDIVTALETGRRSGLLITASVVL